MRYLIYGAYGYTGVLISNLAKENGFDFEIAGRNADKIKELGESIGVKYHTLSLGESEKMVQLLEGFDVVIHAAGPFSQTVRPMIDACLNSKTHYMDITGEIEVFEYLKSKESEAKEKGIFMLPGAGFDVVPTDCLAAYLKSKLPDAKQLEMGFRSSSSFSRGTALTMAESLHKGGAVRRDGKIINVPNAFKTRKIEKQGKNISFVSIPWGDVSTSFHSTQIPNITIYFGAHPKLIKRMKRMNMFRFFLGLKVVQNMMKKRIKRSVTGPSEQMREEGNAWLWGEARNAKGKVFRAEMDTPEGYKLTAMTVIQAMQEIEKKMLSPGFYTPSLAFGEEFILKIKGVTRRHF